MLQRITKRQAFKLFCEGKAFILCPCKFHPYPPFSMGYNCLSGKEWMKSAKWHEPKTVPVTHQICGEQIEGPDPCWKGSLEKTAWELMYNNWAYYNANCNETGYYAHYYVEG